jgi:hypothetical protein
MAIRLQIVNGLQQRTTEVLTLCFGLRVPSNDVFGFGLTFLCSIRIRQRLSCISNHPFCQLPIFLLFCERYANRILSVVRHRPAILPMCFAAYKSCFSSNMTRGISPAFTCEIRMGASLASSLRGYATATDHSLGIGRGQQTSAAERNKYSLRASNLHKGSVSSPLFNGGAVHLPSIASSFGQ